MKTLLMHKDHDFDMERKLPPDEQALVQDLELNILFNAMAQGDGFLLQIARRAVLTSLNDPGAILYRQDILKDCLGNPSVVRGIYDLATETIENRKRHWWGFSSRLPGSILYSAREGLEMFVEQLKKLTDIAGKQAGKFKSEGFCRFFEMLERELDDEFFGGTQYHLRELKFRDGVLISAQLGRGNKGVDYILRKSRDPRRGWFKRLFSKKEAAYSFCIDNRDEAGARALSELRDRGINLAANALAQSTEHILSFFNTLRTELAFYAGCLNLHDQLARMGEPVCFSVPAAAGERTHSFRGLYDICLALRMGQKVVGNDVNADGKDLAIITGANRGGKSTFLRGIGLAQLMMQCGMFTPAESFCANVCDGLFTHYKREEDASMKSGKLDEELARMSDIANNVRKNSLVLFNESFAATNEREGSEIAAQIVSALSEKRIKIFYVTHLYEFAHRFYSKGMGNAVFLRAERQDDGGRTFKVAVGAPLQTSYGEDLYKRIFGADGSSRTLSDLAEDCGMGRAAQERS